MVGKNKTGKKPGCPAERRLMEAWLRGEPSLEREVFLMHANSCPRCGRRLELVDQLRKDMVPHLNRIPEIAPTASEAGALRRTAREEIRRLSGSVRGPSLAPRLSPLRLAAAALAVVLAAGAVFLLTRPGRQEVYRTEMVSVEEGMSPQGILKESPSVFQWNPFPGAAHYTFELIDEKLDLLVRGERSPGTRFVLPREVRAKIAVGQTYIWTVIAFDRDFNDLEERSASFTLQ